jgi:ATPase family AAA domain-containing protein 3A/B
MSEDLRNALNAFLYRTGEASPQIMLVYASNQPEQFDWAINDRIDDIIQFDLPQYPERLRILTLYMDKYIKSTNLDKRSNIVMNGIEESMIEKIALETDGYSGRELCKLVIAWQSSAYGNNSILDPELLFSVFDETKRSKAKKLEWYHAKEMEKLIQNSKS